jgi:hypothetical protein
MYYSGGCDHFGASLNVIPTKTTYRWLVETTPGNLAPFGTNASLPAPVWRVAPPAVPGAQPVAVAAVLPPAPQSYEFGDAMWAKVFVTELPEAVNAEDLRHMVVDDPDVDIMPEPAEVEIEWVLMQASTENENEQEFGGGAEVGEGNEAVSRRFEFYRYTGAYDAETHEALCDDPVLCPDAVGDLVGAQNMAVNLPGGFVANSTPVAANDSAETLEDTFVSIPIATLVGNDSDADGDPLSISAIQNGIGGTASIVGTDVVFTPAADFHGAASFTYTVSDGRLGTDDALVAVTVSAVNDAPVADAGANVFVKVKDTVTLDGSGSSDVDGDSLTYAWTLVSTPAKSHATLTDATTASPSFVPDKKGTFVVSLVVSDGNLQSVADTVTIQARTGK